MDELKFKFVDENGNEKECKKLHTFKNGNDNYIIYTDYTLNFNGEFNVYASKYNINNDKIELYEINDDEWELINKEWGAINV